MKRAWQWDTGIDKHSVLFGLEWSYIRRQQLAVVFSIGPFWVLCANHRLLTKQDIADAITALKDQMGEYGVHS